MFGLCIFCCNFYFLLIKNIVLFFILLFYILREGKVKKGLQFLFYLYFGKFSNFCQDSVSLSEITMRHVHRWWEMWVCSLILPSPPFFLCHLIFSSSPQPLIITSPHNHTSRVTHHATHHILPHIMIMHHASQTPTTT